MNNTDTFESYGIGFQNCVLQGVLIDRDFFEKIENFSYLSEKFKNISEKLIIFDGKVINLIKYENIIQKIMTNMYELTGA